MEPRAQTRWALVFVAASFALYFRSLPYAFVYDDRCRIIDNAAIRSLANAGRFVLDPLTQASDPRMGTQTYRPLVTLTFALTRAAAGLRPPFYRAQNIFFHGINAFLVSALGVETFGLSAAAAALAGAVFLSHPVHVEAVAWISGWSDVVGVFFILFGLIAWSRYQRSGRLRFFSFSVAAFVAGLLTRETAICFPLAALLIGEAIKHVRARPVRRYAILLSLAGFYLIVRRLLLGHVAQAPFWGGTPSSNAANALRSWLLSWRLLVWPHPLRVAYESLPVFSRFLSLETVPPLLFALATAAVIAFLWNRRRPLAVSLSLSVLFWLPASGFVPLATLFNERLLYPVLPFMALSLALALESAARESVPPAARARVLAMAALIVVAPSVVLVERQLPVWRDDESLWRWTVAIEPGGWHAWMCLAQALVRRSQAEPDRRDPARSSALLAEAEEFYIRGLRCRPPAMNGGEMFLDLAEVNLLRGEKALAAEHARRGLALRPDLREPWEESLRADVVVSTSPK